MRQDLLRGSRTVEASRTVAPVSQSITGALPVRLLVSICQSLSRAPTTVCSRCRSRQLHLTAPFPFTWKSYLAFSMPHLTFTLGSALVVGPNFTMRSIPDAWSGHETGIVETIFAILTIYIYICKRKDKSIKHLKKSKNRHHTGLWVHYETGYNEK